MAKQIIRNLRIGVGVSLLMLLVSSYASYMSIQKQLENRENLSKSRRSITAVKDVLLSLLDAETGNRGYQLTGDETFLEPYDRGINAFPDAIYNVKKLRGDDAIQGPKIKELERAVTERFAILQNLIDTKKAGKEVSNNDLLRSRSSMDMSRLLVSDFVKYEEEQLEIKGQDLKDSAAITRVLLFIFVLITLAVTLYLYRKLKGDIVSRDKLQKELQVKDQLISNKIHAIQLIANQVANGDYSKRAIAEEEDDLGELVTSLNHMTDSLQISFDKINKSDWYQKGLAKLNEVLVGNKSVKDVAKLALYHLVEYGNSVTGALYLAVDNRLVLTSSYGLENNVKSLFNVGEGVLGQAFVQKKYKAYNDIQDNDRIASFASAELKINAIMIVPIMLGRKSVGIVELTSGNNYDEDAINFYVESCRLIGIALSAAISREEKQTLLEATQQQAKELQQQHEELENLNAELEAQTQKLQASEEELRVQQEELSQSNNELAERSRLLEEKNQQIADRNIEIQKKAKELALSTKYKSEFLANMSHELRTPLNSILLLSRLMSENPDENLTEDQIESAKVILSSGNSLLTLIDEILDLAKIESGKMSLDYQKIKINDVIEGIKNMFQPLVNEKGLEMKFNLESDVNNNLEIDRLRLDQVLRNLISNALKFTTEGGIYVTISNDDVKPNFINIAVKDTGIGIPKEKQKIIFEAFQQADGSTRRKFGGTGLGLSISREIAKLLGGQLILKSDVNQGSEFILNVPIAPKFKKEYVSNNEVLMETIQEDVKEIKAIIKEDQDQQNSTDGVVLPIPTDIMDDRSTIGKGDKVILIVEDDVNFATALSKYAKRQGYKVVSVVRGDLALSAALQYHPLAILLDIQLPVKDGWSVMDDLKGNSQTKNIPVHMMSSANAKEESISKGAIDFIDKPIALEQMSNVFKKIEEALKNTLQKVLIVEENGKHASALSYFLGNFNISTAVESQEDKVVHAFQNDDVDCVILNLEKSENKDYEIIEKIKMHKGLENLPTIMFIDRNLSQSEELRLKKYADSIVVKTAHSYQRILDEVGLFLHLVEEKGNKEDRKTKNLGALSEVLNGKKVLVTDDDVRNIFSLTKVLEQYKMEVILAMDGKQALEQLKEHNDVDVVLMDMMMPEMDGYETISEIKKQPQYRNLPIIAVTAKSMVGEREKCIEAGASDYISKPVDTDQLLSLLRVWLYEG